jgi:hypothetical protein
MHNQKAFKFHSGSQAVVGNADPGPSYTRDTPSRSQSQLRLPFETPSRSTGRNQRSPRANRTESRLGDMGPPPPPRFDTSAFKTPMSQSRHGKVFSTKPVPSPGFKGFQNAFSAGLTNGLNVRMRFRPWRMRMNWRTMQGGSILRLEKGGMIMICIVRMTRPGKERIRPMKPGRLDETMRQIEGK